MRCTMRRARIRGIPLALAIVGLTAATGCTPRADSTVAERERAEAPRRGGSFHMMFEAPGTMDPSLIDDVYESCVINQIYDGLLEFDVNLNPIPAIAREWSVSRNGLEYRISLRQDVRFHNGRSVVASDVVYSFTRIFDPEREDHGLGGEYLQRIKGSADYAAGKVQQIEGLMAVNDTTVMIVLDRPYGSFLSALAMDQTKIVAREEIERWGDEYDEHPVGTGPFIFDRIEETDDDYRIFCRRNDDYFDQPAWVDEVVFHAPHDYNVDIGTEALFAGILSMCDLSGDQKEAVEADPRFVVIRRPELSFSFVGMNVEREPFRDVRVRRAVAHAIDREALLAVDPIGRMPAVGILPPGMFGYSPEIKMFAYDPEIARQLLVEAGYPGGEGLPPVMYHQADRGAVGRTADELMRRNLAAVGIDVKYVYTDWDQFSEDLDNHMLPAFGLTWVADVPDPDSFLASLFMTTGVYNLFKYSNQDVDDLLDQGARMRSSRDRALLYRRAETIILRDAAVIPLFHIANNFAVRAEIRGLQVTPFGYGNLEIERVWIDSPAM